MIQKFTKNPVVVEAIRYNNLNRDEIQAFIDRKVYHELETDAAWLAGVHPPTFSISFDTRDGIMKAMKGDWVIKETLHTGQVDIYTRSNGNFRRLYSEIKDENNS